MVIMQNSDMNSFSSLSPQRFSWFSLLIWFLASDINDKLLFGDLSPLYYILGYISHNFHATLRSDLAP